MITYTGMCSDCHSADNCPDAMFGDGCQNYIAKHNDEIGDEDS